MPGPCARGGQRPVPLVVADARHPQWRRPAGVAVDPTPAQPVPAVFWFWPSKRERESCATGTCLTPPRQTPHTLSLLHLTAWPNRGENETRPALGRKRPALVASSSERTRVPRAQCRRGCLEGGGTWIRASSPAAAAAATAAGEQREWTWAAMVRTLALAGGLGLVGVASATHAAAGQSTTTTTSHALRTPSRTDACGPVPHSNRGCLKCI